MSKQIVTINSRKIDGKIDKCWQAELLNESKEILHFVGVFEKEIIHTHLGTIRAGTISYEYYWKNKPFNIFRFHEPEGHLRNFYCNINLPPIFKANILNYVDLDIDILVWKDMNPNLVDLDEFLENSSKYNYSTEIYQIVLAGMNEVIKLIKSRSFPFDYTD